QGFEIQVDLPDGDIGPGYAARAAEAFHAAYARKHRWSEPGAAVEAVDWTLVATLPNPQRSVLKLGGTDGIHGAERKSVRQAWFPEAGGFAAARVVNRPALVQQGTIEGPAIVEDPDSTAVIPPGSVARISPAGNLRIDVAPQGGRT